MSVIITCEQCGKNLVDEWEERIVIKSLDFTQEVIKSETMKVILDLDAFNDLDNELKMSIITAGSMLIHEMVTPITMFCRTCLGEYFAEERREKFHVISSVSAKKRGGDDES